MTKRILTEQELQGYLEQDTKKIGKIFIGKLYHGTNHPKPRFGKDSCFTENIKTAEDYAYFWANEAWEEKVGVPCVLIVDGVFYYNGSPDEYKAINIKKIVKIIRCDLGHKEK